MSKTRLSILRLRSGVRLRPCLVPKTIVFI